MGTLLPQHGFRARSKTRATIDKIRSIKSTSCYVGMICILEGTPNGSFSLSLVNFEKVCAFGSTLRTCGRPILLLTTVCAPPSTRKGTMQPTENYGHRVARTCVTSKARHSTTTRKENVGFTTPFRLHMNFSMQTIKCFSRTIIRTHTQCCKSTCSPLNAIPPNVIFSAG